MFLKSLTMKGFKSFAEPTTLEFEPGVTVVVGPNGSGKSNVVDAVAWVLGAQGPRTLRSAKMDDVIFAGTGKRPALGRAEVSLTIDNASGLLPVELSEVTLTRTLFRSGESEYAINQAPCRLLDIQELLSDSGVGRQQHVIVSQGQLDAVLNARPEDRRLLIEEAAGVLKYRRRREKAERRLEATEGNLVRLGDLLREVRRSIRPLERQADAVRRHDGLAQELHALRLHLVGRELVSLTRQRQASADVMASLTLQSGQLSRALAELDSQVAALEGEISESNHDVAALNLGRLQGLIERGRGLGGVLVERRRSLLAVMQSSVDQGLIPALEAELAKLDVELEAIEVEARGLMGRSDELAQAEAAVALDQEAFRSRFEGPALVPGADPSQAAPPERSGVMALTSLAQGQAAAHARSTIEALRHSLEREQDGVERLAARHAELVARHAQIQAEETASVAEAVQIEEEGTEIAQRSHASSLALARATEMVHIKEAEFSAADGEAHRWEARTEALALALDQARARAGAERLADVTDVVGTLADLVKVDAGWEAAFEAAVGEAAMAVVVGGAQEARASLGHLAAMGESGSVLALALGSTHPEWRPAAAAVAGGRAVRDHVSSSRPEVAQLLDRLLDRAVVVDGSWPEAIDIHLSHPEMVVVTRGGDRVSTWSWRIGTAGPGATGAALEEAKAAGVVAGQRRQAARVALEQARSELVACQEVASNMTRANLQNEARNQANKVGIQRHRADAEAIGDQMGKLLAERGELAERMGRDQAKLDQLCGLLPSLEAEEAEEANRRAQVHDARRHLEERVAAVAALRTEFEVMAAGLGERRTILGQRRADVSQQLGRNRSRREGAASQRLEHERALGVVDSLSAWLEQRMALLESEVSSLDAELREAHDQARLRTTRLDELRRSRAESERLLSGVRERIGRAEIEEAENRLRYEAACDVVRRELDVEPEAAINAHVPELSPGQNAAGRSRELERELRLMGPINPLALEELEALTERHQFLESQMEDVRNSRRELFKVIRAIDSEIVDVFASAYEDVAQNFSQLFATLFPGGTGRLSLTQPENLLETGIDVDARPAGKNVRKLSLLSGGERSLVAMAFLFAVFRSRPSPFYLMDEVEAALDDVNLHRFLSLVHEFRSEAQLVIVSHQKRTMEAADSLIGVSMQPGETSKVVSEKLQASA